LILSLAGAIFTTGCGGDARRSTGKRNDDLQTVEVAPPPDARIDVGTDKQERRRSEVFSGVLPGGFPRSFPLPPHSTLVDQGGGPGGPWVELLVPQKTAAVRDPYLQRLRAGGWGPTAAGADAWRCDRGGSRVRVLLRAQGPSTRVRLEY